MSWLRFRAIDDPEESKQVAYTPTVRLSNTVSVRNPDGSHRQELLPEGQVAVFRPNEQGLTCLAAEIREFETIREAFASP